MRKVLMITAAALALSATGAMAGPHGMGGVGGHAAISGGGGGGMARGPMGSSTAAPNIGANMNNANMHANVRGNFAAQSNVAPRGNMAPLAAGPNRIAVRGNRYAYRGDHDHDHGRWHGQGYGGGWGGGLYAFEPGYDSYDYDDDYADNSCYQPRWVPTPYGMRWRDVWVCD